MGWGDISDWRDARRWERTAQLGDSRPLTRREERRFSRTAGRRYMHMVAMGRSCNQGGRFGYSITCWRCLWRDITGRNRRDFRRYVAEIKAHRAALHAAHPPPCELFKSMTSKCTCTPTPAPRPGEGE